MKQAEVVSDPRFLQLMRFTALAQQTLGTVKKLETKQDQDNAIVFFDRVKKALTVLEDFRHEVVDFPTKFTQLINTMFRTPRQQLEGVKQHFSSLLSAYDAAEREKVAKAQAEAAKQPAQAQTELPLEDGMASVPMQPEVPATPPTTTKVEGTNAKVTMREVLEFEVVDKLKFLKAVISTSKGNAIYTLDMVELKETEIKKLCEGKRKIPGVQWNKGKKAV